MAMRDKHGIYWVTALFLVFVLILGVLNGCRRGGTEPDEPAAPNDVAVTPVARTTSADPIQTAANLFREPKPSLQAIIKGAEQRWDAVMPEWWGRPAPDFTLTDLDGKPHRLSDYRGRDVIVVFWATWCGPCKLQIPHWKELRSSLSRDKLAILAISNEQASLVKGTATEQGINYTVLLNPGTLPAPYSEVKFIPSSLFIGADGNIKLGVRGIVPVEDAKAILQAQ
jgi:peroxiredoxin